jgi:hypothetical protein
LSVTEESYGPAHSSISVLDISVSLRVGRCCNFFARRLMFILLNEVLYP